VLFSRKEIADFINKTFEPVWESVRPVPIVRLDFGNGRVVTRTLHGNIATYVCDGSERVLDVLPGIYAPQAYLDRLNQLRMLAQYVEGPARSANDALLASYHDQQAGNLAKGAQPALFVAAPSSDLSKMRIERKVKVLLLPASQTTLLASLSARREESGGDFVSGQELSEWNALTNDTAVNETVRRRRIHEKLAHAGPVSPADIKKWLYKEVLHADLDDPYLGLQPLLSAGYPFKDDLPE
jgi:hypothetical protein